MFRRYTFTVHPFGAQFQTSLISDIPFIGSKGDRTHAYWRAHSFAAAHAALGITSHVLRSDTSQKRYGFGSGALSNPNCILRRIIDSGIAAYFDFASTSWVPLPKEEEEVTHAIISKRHVKS